MRAHNALGRQHGCAHNDACDTVAVWTQQSRTGRTLGPRIDRYRTQRPLSEDER